MSEKIIVFGKIIRQVIQVTVSKPCSTRLAEVGLDPRVRVLHVRIWDSFSSPRLDKLIGQADRTTAAKMSVV